MDAQDNELFSALEQQLARERGPRAWLRERPTLQRVALALAACVALPVGVMTVWARVDLAVFPRSRLALDLALLVAAAAPALWLALRPLYRSVIGVWAGPALLALAAVCAWAVSALPAAHALHPESLLGVGDDFGQRASACFIVGLVWSVPLVVLMRMLDRAPRIRPPALVVGGVVGMIALHLHCPLVSPRHLLVGHASVVGLFVAIGAFITWNPRRDRVRELASRHDSRGM